MSTKKEKQGPTSACPASRRKGKSLLARLVLICAFSFPPRALG